MSGAQALKRVPRIKFPQRHPKPSGPTSQSQVASTGGDNDPTFFSKSSPKTVGGKACLQPKRTPVSNEEIEAILLELVVHMMQKKNVLETMKSKTMEQLLGSLMRYELKK